MIKPVRIQLSRRKGFRLQEHSLALNGLHAMKVDRSTRWGNPFRVDPEYDERLSLQEQMRRFDKMLRGLGFWVLAPNARFDGVKTTMVDVCQELRGKNLACWCASDQLCHADILLELANK